MGSDILPANLIFHNTFLIATHLHSNRSEICMERSLILFRENRLTKLRTWRVRLLTLLRPSDTTQTTTFFHPSGPHIFERLLLHRCATFLITLKTAKIKRLDQGKNRWILRRANLRIHRFAKQNLVLVIHGHDNEEFRVTTP